MKKLLNIIKMILVVVMFFSSSVMVNAATGPETEIQPMVQIIPCNGNSTTMNLVQEKGISVIKQFGLWMPPGGSITVTQEHVFSVSNSANFALIPELVDFGFSTNYSSSISLSQSIPNNTGEYAEFVAIAVFNLYNVRKLTSIGGGYCELSANGNYKVYRGTGYDFRA